MEINNEIMFIFVFFFIREYVFNIKNIYLVFRNIIWDLEDLREINIKVVVFENIE